MVVSAHEMGCSSFQAVRRACTVPRLLLGNMGLRHATSVRLPVTIGRLYKWLLINTGNEKGPLCFVWQKPDGRVACRMPHAG
jgi:hypothetical protein